MNIQSYRPAGMHPTHGYSHTISISRARTILVSGQVAFDQQRELVGEGDFAAQARQAFENVGMALEAAGAGFDDVVRLDYFVTRFDDAERDALVAVRDGFVTGAHPPVTTLQCVSSLGGDGLMIEIVATAAVAD